APSAVKYEIPRSVKRPRRVASPVASYTCTPTGCSGVGLIWKVTRPSADPLAGTECWAVLPVMRTAAAAPVGVEWARSRAARGGGGTVPRALGTVRSSSTSTASRGEVGCRGAGLGGRGFEPVGGAPDRHSAEREENHMVHLLSRAVCDTMEAA